MATRSAGYVDGAVRVLSEYMWRRWQELEASIEGFLCPLVLPALDGLQGQSPDDYACDYELMDQRGNLKIWSVNGLWVRTVEGTVNPFEEVLYAGLELTDANYWTCADPIVMLINPVEGDFEPIPIIYPAVDDGSALVFLTEGVATTGRNAISRGYDIARAATISDKRLPGLWAAFEDFLPIEELSWADEDCGGVVGEEAWNLNMSDPVRAERGL